MTYLAMDLNQCSFALDLLSYGLLNNALLPLTYLAIDPNNLPNAHLPMTHLALDP